MGVIIKNLVLVPSIAVFAAPSFRSQSCYFGGTCRAMKTCLQTKGCADTFQDPGLGSKEGVGTQKYVQKVRYALLHSKIAG